MAEAKKPTTTASAKTTAAKPGTGAAPAKSVAMKPAAKSAAKTTVAKSTAAKPATVKSAAAKAPTPGTKKAKAPAGPKVNTLRVHHLKPAAGAKTPKTRVGRGEGGTRGKTAGRGTKGTGARYQVSPRFEGGQTPIHMRIPKLRGFKSPFKVTYQVVNLSALLELYPKGGEVTKAGLVAKGAVRKNVPVKVLGDGDITVRLTVVDVDKVSRSARSKIEAAGGSVNQG
jgi:large subunit ribosomal protein L15